MRTRFNKIELAIIAKVFRLAAERIVVCKVNMPEDEYFGGQLYACCAINRELLNWNVRDGVRGFYMEILAVPETFSYTGSFGSPCNRKNQDARVISLLLAAEIANDMAFSIRKRRTKKRV